MVVDYLQLSCHYLVAGGSILAAIQSTLLRLLVHPELWGDVQPRGVLERRRIR
jgi:hypothetical protein